MKKILLIITCLISLNRAYASQLLYFQALSPASRSTAMELWDKNNSDFRNVMLDWYNRTILQKRAELKPIKRLHQHQAKEEQRLNNLLEQQKANSSSTCESMAKQIETLNANVKQKNKRIYNMITVSVKPLTRIINIDPGMPSEVIINQVDNCLQQLDKEYNELLLMQKK